jgi:hypothetical protein
VKQKYLLQGLQCKSLTKKNQPIVGFPTLKKLTPVMNLSQRPCTTTVDAGPLPSSDWASWSCFEMEMEVEAAQGVPYRRPTLIAVKLFTEVYTS